MMMTAPDVKQEPPANSNAQHPTEQAQVAVAAAGSSPRAGAQPAAMRSSIPPNANAPKSAGATLGRPGSPQMKATMIGAGVASNTAAQKPEQKHATMLGAALAPTTPRSKPPGVVPASPAASGASVVSGAKFSLAPQAKASSNPPPQAQEIAKSERPPVVRQTIPQASTSPSVRAVQSMPVSPSPEGAEPPRPAPAAPAATTAPVLHDAQTVPSPLPPRAEARTPNPARMVQAIPEVDGTVVDPSELPEHVRNATPRYLPGDPMAPQPSASARAPRLREHPFAPEAPEVEGHGNYIMLYWALCVAIVAAACALAFRLF
ncbi:MAG TPA: hypothetical protein VMF89_26405 [Polyangiales bacterium]|nr:hypothetical protein [Polyangiales bacterium]